MLQYFRISSIPCFHWLWPTLLLQVAGKLGTVCHSYQNHLWPQHCGDSHMDKGFLPPSKLSPDPSSLQFLSSNLRVLCNLQKRSRLSSHVVYLTRSAVGSLVNLFSPRTWIKMTSDSFQKSICPQGQHISVCRDTLFVKVPTNVEFSSRKGKPKIFVEQK